MPSARRAGERWRGGASWPPLRAHVAGVALPRLERRMNDGVEQGRVLGLMRIVAARAAHRLRVDCEVRLPERWIGCLVAARAERAELAGGEPHLLGRVRFVALRAV